MQYQHHGWCLQHLQAFTDLARLYVVTVELLQTFYDISTVEIVPTVRINLFPPSPSGSSSPCSLRPAWPRKSEPYALPKRRYLFSNGQNETSRTTWIFCAGSTLPKLRHALLKLLKKTFIEIWVEPLQFVVQKLPTLQEIWFWNLEVIRALLNTQSFCHLAPSHGSDINKFSPDSDHFSVYFDIVF
jgi:hypothetical protein